MIITSTEPAKPAEPAAPCGFSPRVSMVRDATGKEPVLVSASTAISAIKNGRYRPAISKIRALFTNTLQESGAAEAKRAVAPYKKELPAVMWSGSFSGRGDDKLIEYSHLLCADLDELAEDAIGSISTDAVNDPHVWALFRSPTNSGLKMVFRVGGGAEQHQQNYLAVKAHVHARYNGAQVDEACKNVERLCFVSEDPGAFCNEHAIPLEPVRVVEANLEPVGSPALFQAVGDRRAIAEKLVGAIDWINEQEGFCTCPGKHLHTSGNGVRDCKVLLGGAPTVYCFHSSCQGVRDGINHVLRSEIGKAEYALARPSASIAAPVDPDKWTEYDYANRLAEQLPPLRTCGNVWTTYRDGAWQEIGRDSLRPIAQSVLPPVIRTERRAVTLLDHLESRNQVPRDSFRGFYLLDNRGDVLLNASNGIVRVRPNGEGISLEPHSPDHLFVYRLAAAYTPDSSADLFKRILAEALPDEMDRVLFQLCCGNFLLPDCRFETALVCYGEAGRGKSTIAEPIAGALGRELVPRLTMSQICDPKSYHVPKLARAAVNLGTELDAIELGDSGPFKTIVSGEPVEARPIYGEPITMSTTCKLWFLANCLPRFKHGTEAELRRTRFLRFDYLPPRKDVNLKTKLAAERDGVFLWMLEGLAELLTLPCIPLGGHHSREVHDRFRISNDPVGAFVSTRCHLDPSATVSKEVLKTAYDEFCEQHELSPTVAVWFFRSLYERWTCLKETRVGDRRTRMIAGIQLKP